MDKRNQRQTPKKAARPGLAADYSLLPGIPDEMKDAAGNIRPGWTDLLAGFDELGLQGLTDRFERADQYLATCFAAMSDLKRVNVLADLSASLPVIEGMMLIR